MIAPLNLALWCLVAATVASSSAEPININSDYSIEPSDRVCHPFCGDEQDQGDCLRHLNGGSLYCEKSDAKWFFMVNNLHLNVTNLYRTGTSVKEQKWTSSVMF